MIEAVNATIANSAALRGVAEQAVSARAVELQTQERQPVEPVLAPYVSPYIQVDASFDTAVIQIRDSDTGDVLSQFPSEPSLRSRQAVETFLEGGREREIVQAQTFESTQPTNTASESVQTVTIAQSTPPAQSLGAGGAQAAITALSTGAASGQSAPTANVQVQA